MNVDIGSVAGVIWQILRDKGEMSVAALKKSAASKGVKEPVLDWAIGWLAREDKLVFRKERNTVKISLRP